MIIGQVKKIPSGDVQRYCWARIAQFQNPDHVTALLTRLHSLPKQQLMNAKRQAEQIKYCLAQAKEYLDAATAVSLATRPVLLYYGVMSMALAEILLKQNADSRLAKLRENHGCHGLSLVISADPRAEDSLQVASSQLSAKTQVDKLGAPKGTFEIWRRSAREYPVAGNSVHHDANGSTTSFAVLLGAVDVELPVLPLGGASLFDCLVDLPFMADTLEMLGTRLKMIRTTVKAGSNNQSGSVSTIIHPQQPELIDAFLNLVKCEADAVNGLEFLNVGSTGLIIKSSQSHPSLVSWPPGVSAKSDEVFFSCSSLGLNEFGNIYVATHICGNFARYYPDLWLKHIEKSSPLALAIDELCKHALERVPVLTLSELARNYLVVE